jgi:hypothetical protein
MLNGGLVSRTPGGRFAPGVSGNPRGRPKGSRSKASVFAEAMREGEGVALARRCLDEAQEGDNVSMRFALGRIEPARRGRPVTLKLLPGEERDPHAVLARAIRAVAEGELTPEEGYWIGRLAALKRATPLDPGVPNEPWDEVDPEEWVIEGIEEEEGDEADEAEEVATEEPEGDAATSESSPCLRGEGGGGNSPPLRQPSGVGLLPPPAPPPQAGEEGTEVAAEEDAEASGGTGNPLSLPSLRDGPLPLPGGAREGGGEAGSTCYSTVLIRSASGRAMVTAAPAVGGGTAPDSAARMPLAMGAGSVRDEWGP